MRREGSDFGRVYEDNVWRVYGFLAYRVRNHDLAEDLTQTTFERALRAWSRFDPRRASTTTWLLAIARNLLIDHHRRDRSSLTEEIDERLAPIVAGPELSPESPDGLTEALATLSNREREILALRFGGDLTGPEIAEILGLSLANVQQIMSRALRKLRQVMAADNPPRPGAEPPRTPS